MINPNDPNNDPYAGYDPYGPNYDPNASQQASSNQAVQNAVANAQAISTANTATAQAQQTTDAGIDKNRQFYGNENAFRDAWLASGGKTVTDLKNFAAQHPEFGVTIGGSKGDKVYGPDKSYWADAVLSAGNNGGTGASWNKATGGSGGGGSTSTAIDPSYLAPYDASLPQIPNGPDVPNTPDFSYQDFGGFDPWAPTTAQDVYNDPSYNFRMNEGAGMIENTASARGLLNSGGTLKDLLKYGQNFASNEYSNIDSRRFNAWDTGNQNKLNTYATNRNNAASNFATNYGLSTDRYNQLLNQSNTAYDRGVGQYTTNRDTYYANQNNPFNKLQSLAQLGMSAASQ